MHRDDDSCEQGGSCLPLPRGGAAMPVRVQGGQAAHDQDKDEYSLEGGVDQPAYDCLEVKVLVARTSLIQPCSGCQVILPLLVSSCCVAVVRSYCASSWTDKQHVLSNQQSQ